MGVVALVVAASALPASAADEPITGTACDQRWRRRFDPRMDLLVTRVASARARCTSGFTIDFSTSPLTTSGVNVLDALRRGNAVGDGDGDRRHLAVPFVVTTTSIMGNGTGALAGVTAVIVLTGTGPR